MTDKQVIKICCICGDKAIGTNFGATTCESCKAFFRRTAVKNKLFICPFDEKCIITSITRKFCQKCRIEKCFAMGMKRESILNDKEKQMIRIKIEENRKRRRLTEESTRTSGSNKYSSSESELDNEIQTQITEIKSYISSTHRIHCFDGNSAHLKHTVQSIVQPITDYKNNFNELEGNKLTELLNAIELIREPVFKHWTSEIKDIEELRGEITDRFDRETRKLVNFVKNMTGFRDICSNDQISLVKYCCVEVFNMRSIVYYNRNSEEWVVPIDDNNSVRLKLDIFRDSKSDMYSAFRTYLSKMGKEWNSDFLIVDLITAILIFNPNSPGLLHRDVVLYQQKIYLYLLQRYLLLRYRSESESKSKYLRLMSVLNDVYILGQTLRVNVAEREDLGPFLKEILDINS